MLSQNNTSAPPPRPKNIHNKGLEGCTVTNTALPQQLTHTTRQRRALQPALAGQAMALSKTRVHVAAWLLPAHIGTLTTPPAHSCTAHAGRKTQEASTCRQNNSQAPKQRPGAATLPLTLNHFRTRWCRQLEQAVATPSNIGLLSFPACPCCCWP